MNIGQYYIIARVPKSGKAGRVLMILAKSNIVAGTSFVYERLVFNPSKNSIDKVITETSKILTVIKDSDPGKIIFSTESGAKYFVFKNVINLRKV